MVLNRALYIGYIVLSIVLSWAELLAPHAASSGQVQWHSARQRQSLPLQLAAEATDKDCHACHLNNQRAQEGTIARTIQLLYRALTYTFVLLFVHCINILSTCIKDN